MRKYTLLLFFPVFLLSCSTSKEFIGSDSNKEQDILFKGHTTLIIKQRKEIEHYARFSYYSNYTTLIDEVAKGLSARGYKVISSQVPVFSASSREEVRSLAARYGADRIIWLNEKYSRDTSINVLAITYLTIIGMYIFPGNSMKASCTIEGELLNADTGDTIRHAFGIANSHRYVYRIGNADSALYASYLESMKKASQNFIENIGKESAKVSVPAAAPQAGGAN